MPKPSQLAKAQLIEMAPGLLQPAPGATPINVQFNPESLKVTYSNQVAPSDSKGSQTGTAALQHVGAGTTKLAVQLWFDVTHPTATDVSASYTSTVRELTSKVTYFITPQENPKGSKKYTIPGVKFLWGKFSFVGVMESVDENLELFSSDGRPIRASVSFGLTQQEILAFEPGQGLKPPVTAGTLGGKAAGTVPLATASAGVTLQGLADTVGSTTKDWQDIAAANGIENPRLLDPGQLIDVNASAGVSF